MRIFEAIAVSLPTARECAEVCRRCGERRGQHIGMRGQWCRPGYRHGVRRLFVPSGRYQGRLGQVEIAEVR